LLAVGNDIVRFIRLFDGENVEFGIAESGYPAPLTSIKALGSIRLINTPINLGNIPTSNPNRRRITRLINIYSP